MVSYIFAQRFKFAKNQRDFKTWYALKYMFFVCLFGGGFFFFGQGGVECYRKCLNFSFFPILRKQISCKDKSLIYHIQSLVGMLS